MILSVLNHITLGKCAIDIESQTSPKLCQDNLTKQIEWDTSEIKYVTKYWGVMCNNTSVTPFNIFLGVIGKNTSVTKGYV